jgi:POT family proton-dependent oligopeptide transporter
MSHSSSNPFAHPKSFYLIFSVEMWERFGYYGMNSLLVLFLVQHLGFSDAESDNLFSAFTALVYAFVCVGGYFGDRFIGAKRTMFLGAVVLALGYTLLGVNSDRFLYIGLGTIIAGNALFKSNPSSLVSKLYDPDDPRVDGAFTIYYMSINIGSFIAMLLCPIIKSYYGWNAAFLTSGVGLVAANLNYWLWRNLLAEVGSEPDFQPLNVFKLLAVIAVTAAIAWGSYFLLRHIVVAHWMLYAALFVILVLFVKETVVAGPLERPRLLVCLVLIGEAVVFFILYQQMPTSLNLFVDRNVHHSIFGISLETASFQALNPMWIMIASPILAFLYGRLGSKGRDLPLPAKFALGMMLCSLGFLSLWLASIFFADAQGLISGNWLILSYGCQSLGELLVSGLGLAMVARLVPQRMMGFMMGAWFMATAIAMVLGGYVAAFASIPDSVVQPIQSLEIYAGLFLKIGSVTLALSLLMALLAPKLGRIIDRDQQE